jgi:dipeptidyl aminopeptidase/acylaminoacyl peptidase
MIFNYSFWLSRLVIITVLSVSVQGHAAWTEKTFIPASSPASTESVSSDIAFVSDRDGSEQIYLMDSEGRNQYQLTHIKNIGLGGLSWSPDGKYLAFTLRPNEKQGSAIYTIRAVMRIILQAGRPTANIWHTFRRAVAPMMYGSWTTTAFIYGK